MSIQTNDIFIPDERAAQRFATALHYRKRVTKDLSLIQKLSHIVDALRSEMDFTATTPAEFEAEQVLLTAAWLYKTQDQRFLAKNKLPPHLTTIRKRFGAKVAAIVAELQTEPRDDHQPDTWGRKAKWAETLSEPAQKIQMAEKVFNITCAGFAKDNFVEWATYVRTRLILTEALTLAPSSTHTFLKRFARPTARKLQQQQDKIRTTFIAAQNRENQHT